jgi:hypothetical protein
MLRPAEKIESNESRESRVIELGGISYCTSVYCMSIHPEARGPFFVGCVTPGKSKKKLDGEERGEGTCIRH